MAIKNMFKTVFSSKAKTTDDGRDQWPSRTSFILAAMGGCVGLGNILRYVSGPRQLYLVLRQRLTIRISHRKSTIILVFSGS